ncbi:MAG: hypothetical protein IPK26_15730 [Planctomycetes bacterium]|nr:hypothetical protein [Planctomycetota bacterium]
MNAPGQFQLDLPQVSLARYVDLLKRRRWQVVPVSLLGLLIGGLVAFLIPRYYVANTQLHHQRVPGSPEVRPGLVDPFADVVDNARHTVPLAVGKAMKELGWEEAMVADLSQLAENESAVRSRLEVVDLNPSKVRDWASLRVTYRDRDGKRAAEFVNHVVKAWIEQRLQSMLDAAQQQQSEANERVRLAVKTWSERNAQVQHLQTEYGFDPTLTEALQRAQLQLREAELNALLAELASKETAVDTLQAKVDALQHELDRAPRTVSLAELQADSALLNNVEFKTALAQFEAARKSLAETIKPAHPYYAARVLQMQQAEQKLRELRGGSADTDEVPNPRVAELKKQLAENEPLLAAAIGERDRLRQDRDERQRRQALAFAKHSEYRETLQQLAEATTERNAANAAAAAATALIGELSRERPIEHVPAQQPPRPTEPNILIVAIIGCVVGLGLAIALILALDFLQGTFKTLDDVERALPVPVLGGLSHLETEEQRRTLSRGRRRASLVAATAVVLMVVLVTIYYVYPERLPPFARDLLAMVLGS